MPAKLLKSLQNPWNGVGGVFFWFGGGIYIYVYMYIYIYISGRYGLVPSWPGPIWRGAWKIVSLASHDVYIYVENWKQTGLHRPVGPPCHHIDLSIWWARCLYRVLDYLFQSFPVYSDLSGVPDVLHADAPQVCIAWVEEELPPCFFGGSAAWS